MAAITDIPNTIWRDELLPATYRGAQFFCESGAWESGRRIVEHEFPKRDLPYAEDMGRRAVSFTVRGYCIAYPFDIDDFYQRDYRHARKALQTQLDQGEPGILQLPTMQAMYVVCPRYRLQEEDRLGGYCVFEMEFQEYGLKPPEGKPDPSTQAKIRARQLRLRTIQLMSPNVGQDVQDRLLGKLGP
jgi:prophage DNA circulation protein